MLTVDDYLQLKKSVAGLIKKYGLKVFLKALADVCIIFGDYDVLKSIEAGDVSKRKEGEKFCDVGGSVKEIIKKLN